MSYKFQQSSLDVTSGHVCWKAYILYAILSAMAASERVLFTVCYEVICT